MCLGLGLSLYRELSEIRASNLAAFADYMEPKPYSSDQVP